MALPILDHCAVLCAAALVRRLAESRIGNEPNVERFAKLAALPVGHPVRVLAKGKLYFGEVADMAADRTATTFPIAVSTSTNGKSHFLCTPLNCMKVDPCDGVSLAAQSQRGLRVVENAELTKLLLAGPSLEDLCLGSRMDYALVGARSRLLDEAETYISTGSVCERNRLTGPLSDLLRLKEGSRDYRGIIVSTTAKEPRFPQFPPRTAIFSGATGFLKYRDRFPASHQLVLLDRSEPRFREAANQTDRQYYQRAGDGPATLLDGAPRGVECLVFTERS
jgi:hypothetical protein